MTDTKTQIRDLFETLPPDEQVELVGELSQQTESKSFVQRLNAAQRAELEYSISEADRGEGDPAVDVFDRLARKFELKSTK